MIELNGLYMYPAQNEFEAEGAYIVFPLLFAHLHLSAPAHNRDMDPYLVYMWKKQKKRNKGKRKRFISLLRDLVHCNAGMHKFSNLIYNEHT